MNISIFSFFSGVGILDLGFEANDYQIVFVNEYEENFLNSYQYSRQQLNIPEPLYGFSGKNAQVYTKGKNKKRLIELMEKERAKGNLIGFTGGPPCPDFSIGGKNHGRNGRNGKLTKTYFDLICRCKPDFFLFENVKGLVKTEKHKSFYREMKIKASRNGYDIADKLVNALSYSVPQFRERIIMIGIKDGILRNAGIPITADQHFAFPWDSHAAHSIKNLLALNWPDVQDFEENSQRPFIYDVPQELTVDYWFTHNEVAEHPNQQDQFRVKKGREKMRTYREGDTKKKSFKRLHRWRYSPTAAYGNNEVHLHPYKPRRLSVAEAMAIQSLPRDFVLPGNISLTCKYKMIGNGVPYLMADAIAKTLLEFLNTIVEGLLWNLRKLLSTLELSNTLEKT